jgi:glycosyltransferase involved in cell wall biosynthesis
MRIALVAPTYLVQHGALERRVTQLARGLAARGAEVEIITQGPFRGEQYSVLREGVSIRRFPSGMARVRLPVASGFYEGLRASVDQFDLVDVHSGYAPLAFAVARARFRRRVLTPYGAAHRLTNRAYAYLVRSIIESCARVICSSASERDWLSRRFPWAADRILAVPPGVDQAAIAAASPRADAKNVVLAMGRLERANRLERAIAAMAVLDPSLRLLIVGEGPARERLQAYAADMRLSERVGFADRLPECDQYQWLRSARVVLALPDQHASGLEVLEALAAGIPVVVSDIPVHREVAAQFTNPHVIFVSPSGSPLDVADAIAEAVGRRVHAGADGSAVRSEESVVDDMWSIYRDLIYEGNGAASEFNESGLMTSDLGLFTRRRLGG